MLAESSVAGSSGGGGGGGGDAASTREAGGCDRSISGDEEKVRVDEGERSFGGNRWPREETLALLKIRSDMDATFRDSSSKGPLWEEVSRKLAQLGYHRSAKKCKEKFENVYKYHKRTKESRGGKPDSKTYRFFEQLEALEHQSSLASSAPPKPQTTAAVVSAATTIVAMPVAHPPTVPPQFTVPSGAFHPGPTSQNIGAVPAVTFSAPSYPPANLMIPLTATNSRATNVAPSSHPDNSADNVSISTSSSTSSDGELEGRRKRQKKWKDFFDRLMKEVVDKQEELQKKFLQAIEKREHERMIREEAWRLQEMARINREREVLAQERSMAAAKDAAVLAFLQKISDQHNLGLAINNPPLQQQQPPPPPAPPPPQSASPVPQGAAAPPPAPPAVNLEIVKTDNGGESYSLPASSSRWPKVEVQALIGLRTNLEAKYQENGPKGPLWEEISAGMRRLGYNRSAKRCKEKWENINKYFKKVKDSNKKRPEDSKTCPYFHQLDALYREKNRVDNSSAQFKPESTVALMVRPEQQWPPQQEHRPDVAMQDMESEQTDQNQEDEDEEYEEENDEAEDEGGEFQIVANKPPPR